MRAYGYAMNSPDGNSKDLLPLFEAIVKHIPAPPGNPEGRSADIR